MKLLVGTSARSAIFILLSQVCVVLHDDIIDVGGRTVSILWICFFYHLRRTGLVRAGAYVTKLHCSATQRISKPSCCVRRTMHVYLVSQYIAFAQHSSLLERPSQLLRLHFYVQKSPSPGNGFYDIGTLCRVKCPVCKVTLARSLMIIATAP